MNKWCGKIGYGVSMETDPEENPGVFETVITERPYFGDVLKNTRRLQTGASINDDIVVNNQISIVADPYAYENFHNIIYAEFMGTLWKVTNIDEQSPRLILTLGGKYHVGEEKGTS